MACKVDRCDAPAKSRGMCLKHLAWWTYWSRKGQPPNGPAPDEPHQRARIKRAAMDTLRLQRKTARQNAPQPGSQEWLAARTTIDPGTGCYLWRGYVSHRGRGYARVVIDGRTTDLHRHVWRFAALSG
jgi:hypothetical protein